VALVYYHNMDLQNDEQSLPDADLDGLDPSTLKNKYWKKIMSVTIP